MSKLTLSITAFALTFAGAASAASLTLDQPAWVGQTQLKAGQYKIEVQGNTAIFKSGKTAVTVPVTVDKTGKKFNDTSIESNGAKIQQIHLGGSNTTIIIKSNDSAPTAVGNGTGTGTGL
jgi:hypothetical protein